MANVIKLLYKGVSNNLFMDNAIQAELGNLQPAFPSSYPTVHVGYEVRSSCVTSSLQKKKSPLISSPNGSIFSEGIGKERKS